MLNRTSLFDYVVNMDNTQNVTTPVHRTAAENAGALLLVVIATCDVHAILMTRSRRTRRFWAYEGGSYLRTYVQKLSIINAVNSVIAIAVYFTLISWSLLMAANNDVSVASDPFRALALMHKCFNIHSDTLLVTLAFAAIAASAGTRFISFLYSTTDAPEFNLFQTKASGSASTKVKRKTYGGGKQSTSATRPLVAKQPATKVGSDARKWGLKFDTPSIQAAVMPYFVILALLSLLLACLHFGYLPQLLQPLSHFVFNRAICYDAGSRFTQPLNYTDMFGVLMLVAVQCVVCPLVEVYHGKHCSAHQQQANRDDNVEAALTQPVKSKPQSLNMEDSAFAYGEATRTPFVQTTMTFTWGIFLSLLLYVFFYRQYDVIDCVLLQLFWLATDSVFILILCLLFPACNGIVTKT